MLEAQLVAPWRLLVAATGGVSTFLASHHEAGSFEVMWGVGISGLPSDRADGVGLFERPGTNTAGPTGRYLAPGPRPVVG